MRWLIATDIEGRQVATVASLLSHAHRCLPRINRMLSCSQHVHSEPHNAAAPLLDALSLRQALTSVACDGSFVLISGSGKCHSRSWLAQRAQRCLLRVSRVLSCSQHVHHELHSAAAPCV